MKEEGRRKKEEGRRQKAEGRRQKKKLLNSLLRKQHKCLLPSAFEVIIINY
ncbi:hypothetical protein [Okeania sp. SIO3B5]|uniref:hypothetical protein n=1 Tax=Okeania sp. SIO3B5 TaxID=2607811 RepID=UPI0025CC95C2|nr:hypothetical protein [Okeania sp. SIO3B5]